MFTDFREIVSVLLEEYKACLKVKRKPGTQTIFRRFVSSVVTQGRKGVETTLRKIATDSGFEGWMPRNFATKEGKKLLKEYVGHQRKINLIYQQSRRMRDLGLKKWIKSLQENEIDIGQKTRDEFLKEIGLLQYFPIDRYYPPFLARTGLLFHYLETNKADPGMFMRGLDDEKCYNSYKDMMIELCEGNLKGLKYDSLDLSENPGIVDMIVWRHCASKDSGGFEICGRDPNCPNCKINKLCRFGMQTTHSK